MKKWNSVARLPLLSGWRIKDKHLIYIALNGKIAGIVSIVDPIKPDLQKAIADLERAGLKVVMVTGDNPPTANAVAKQVGIEQVIAEVLPEDKVKKVNYCSNKVNVWRWWAMLLMMRLH